MDATVLLTPLLSTMSQQRQDSQRYYASEQYLLPADTVETARLNTQHQVFVRAFGGGLSLIPMTNFKTGDRVLESAAGTGIWALEFYQKHKENGIILDIECIDISDRQFQRLGCPLDIHFSLHSVTDLPAEWTDTFAYIHQRLLSIAMNETLWQRAISELFRTLSSGGWVELVELDLKNGKVDVGPYSSKIRSLTFAIFAAKGIVVDLQGYLPLLLKQVGFVDIQCETRVLPVGRSPDIGYPSEELGGVCRGMMGPILDHGLIETKEEYENIVRESVREWNESNKASIVGFTIIARKP
ncbi:hypothetical protein D9757_006664 [Collybiopsis confluens]|uniref:Methyltransferase domain-containing protein n=1 Tax=Collybiopsis confluens TaxID=2823264 RepID=A0A8H5M9J9_9AGAR|nr:hypothetical protein D9757_006664 [Collybiopsis confluens]